jgi:hypothetical protein
MQERLDALQKHARTETTRSAHDDRTAQLADFLRDSLGMPSVWQAAPADVVMFLVSRDIGGQWVDHAPTCHLAATPPEVLAGLRATATFGSGCRCPTRLRATTVDTIIASLRAVFNERGLTGEFDPVRGTGNPCASYAVRHYAYCVQKAQAAKMVRAQQAPVFSEDSWVQLLDHILDSATVALTRGETATHLEALRDAFLFALLFRSMQRGATILELTEQHLQLQKLPRADREAGRARTLRLHMHIPLTKTGRADEDRHIAVFHDEALPGSVPRLWRTFNRARHAALVDDAPRPAPSDPIFDVRAGANRTGPSSRGARVSRAMTTKDANARLVYWVTQLDPHLPAKDMPSLHSFRGSGAIAALDQGMDPAVVDSFALWKDKGMHDYYVLARQIVDFGVRSPSDGMA